MFSETFDLKRYPFDVQRLAIRIISRRPSAELLLLEDYDGGTSLDTTNFMQDNEWSIVKDLFDSTRSVDDLAKTNLRVIASETPPEYEKDAMARPKAKIAFYIARGYGYHLLNTFFPMFMLTLMAISGYVIDPIDAIGDRLAITTTIVLAIVLFQNGVDEKSPCVSYLTFQTKFKIFCCEVPLFLMVVQNFVANKLSAENPDVDWFTILAWIVLVGVLNVSFAIWAVVLAWTRQSPALLDAMPR